MIISTADAIHIVIVVFSLSTMFAMGLGVTIGEVSALMTNLRAIVRALLANIVLLPLLAWTLVRISHLLPGQLPQLGTYETVGFLLMAFAPGALFGHRLTEIAKGNVPFAVGLMVLLTVVVAVTVPLDLVLFQVNGMDDLQKAAAISGTLALYQLLPLAAGMAIKARYDAVAGAMRPLMIQLAHLSFIVLLVLVWTEEFGWWPNLAKWAKVLKGLSVYTATLVAVIGALFIGYQLGYQSGISGTNTQRALAMTTGVRNVAAALVIADQYVGTPDDRLSTFVAILAFYLVGLILASACAGEWGRKKEPETSSSRGSDTAAPDAASILTDALAASRSKLAAPGSSGGGR